MAARSGRNLVVKRDGVEIAGVRTKGVTINRNPVDITNDDDAGYRGLLAEPGEIHIDISVDGVTKDDALRTAATSTANVFESLTIEWPDGFAITGDWFLASFSENGTYNDAITFSASFQLSGVPQVTPASS